ncbi:hypothetical protein T484DRAFT_1877878 [Baffinella frigidus]|nr:hypothetical protein T484DRAFT_1877878 [Cryptophyta sp. CCMP2293]
MFVGEGVNQLAAGNLVRRVLGLKLARGRKCDLKNCEHAMVGNMYIRTFDGAQWRFGYRNKFSTLVVPPMTVAGPILGANGIWRLHHYVRDGDNTLLILGGVGNILFMNANVATEDGGFDLEPNFVDGPFEPRAEVADSPFKNLGASLPGNAIGVRKASLPRGAISYYEAEDSSVVWELKVGKGRIVYIGFNYDEPDYKWTKALVAATTFPNFYKH